MRFRCFFWAEHSLDEKLPAGKLGERNRKRREWRPHFMDWLRDVLGLEVEPQNLTFLHVILRAVIVFFATLTMVRLADRRFLAKLSAVDAILGLILASMLARAINGSSAFFPTLAGGFVVVFLHKLCVALSFHSEKFGLLVKGREETIVTNGEIKREVLAANHITEDDLLEELRQEGRVSSAEEVKQAVVERSGRISVIAKKDKP
jgi:uncharacterized membrane protein YcaP (DUF421 family)